jgi:CheY-like chemotaxis protein
MELTSANRLRILVVEEHPAVVRRLQEAFSPLGADAVVTTDVAFAKALLTTHKLHGAFLDFDDESLAGASLIGVCRRSPSNSRIPVTMTTERVDTRFIAQACRLGVDYVLHKPVASPQLLRTLDQSIATMLEERQRYQRARQDLPVLCEWNLGTTVGRSLNVSLGGLFGHFAKFPPVGTDVRLTLFLREPRIEIPARGLVVREEPEGRLAIRFTELQPTARKDLCQSIERAISQS